MVTSIFGGGVNQDRKIQNLFDKLNQKNQLHGLTGRENFEFGYAFR